MSAQFLLRDRELCLVKLFFVPNQLQRISVTSFILMVEIFTDTDIALIREEHVGNVTFAEGLTKFHAEFSPGFLLGLGNQITLDFFEAFDFAALHMIPHSRFVYSKQFSDGSEGMMSFSNRQEPNHTANHFWGHFARRLLLSLLCLF